MEGFVELATGTRELRVILHKGDIVVRVVEGATWSLEEQAGGASDSCASQSRYRNSFAFTSARQSSVSADSSGDLSRSGGWPASPGELAVGSAAVFPVEAGDGFLAAA